MDVVYYAARANLRRVMQLHPDWKQKQYAQAVGMSVGWVKKWLKRLREARADDEAVLQGISRARKHPASRASVRWWSTACSRSVISRRKEDTVGEVDEQQREYDGRIG